MLDLLLDRDELDVNRPGGRWNKTAIYAATERGQAEVITELLADPRIKLEYKYEL